MTNILQVSQESIRADGVIESTFLRITANNANARHAFTGLKRRLDVARAMEDIAFVLRDAEELTPTQTALVQVNANAAVAGTDDSAEEIMPDQITMEEFKRSGFDVLGETAKEFADLWCTVRQNLLGVKTINAAAMAKLEILVKELEREASQTSSLGLVIAEQELSIDELPEILHLDFASEKDDYLEELRTCRQNFSNKLRGSTVKVVTDLRTLIHDGMTIFKTSSATAALEELKEHHRTLSSFIQRPALEDVKTSPDGLIVDVELSGGYAVGLEPGSDVPDLILVESGLDLAQEGFTSIGSNVWDVLLAEASANMEVLSLSNSAIETLADSELEKEVEAFGKTAEGILARLPLQSNTKEAVYGYCELFLNAVQIANSEVSFMIYMANFIVAHTELLASVAGKVNQTNSGASCT